jgi:serine/threonine-protein kinase
MHSPMGSAESVNARFALPIARVGGKYSLLRRIAVGGMGEVWAARNETTGAQVALKVLRPERDKRSQAEERFRREARLGGLLTHRNIARIYDFLEEADGTLVLVMELLRGETVEEHLARRGALSAKEALAIMAPVLSALQHGHDHGIVHRDVKPANIFLSTEPDGHVSPKLLDFGIAKIANTGTQTIDGLVLGTPAYMSPEQVRDEALDGRSDLFAIGVVLYELITGSCPFKATGPGASIAAVLSTAVDPDPAIEPRLWLEIQRALAKRPAERHASATEMSAMLCAAIGETEDSLAPVLRRTKPPPQPSDFFESGERASATSEKNANHTQSFEGQSVATSAADRRAPRWVPLAAAGLVALIVGIVAIVGVTRTSATGSASATNAAASSPAAPPASTVLPAVPTGAAEAPIEFPATSAVSGKGATTGAVSAPRPTPATAKTAKVPRGTRPKPIATSPGF